MGFFTKKYSVITLAKTAINQWNHKISSESDKKKMLLDVDIKGLELFSELISHTDNSRTTKWLINEINHAIHNDLSRVMFMGSISSCLALLDESNSPKELKGLSASEMYQVVYMAGIKELDAQPLTPIGDVVDDIDHQYQVSFNESLTNISQSFNLMVANQYSREQILEDHFYKLFSHLDIKGSFASIPTNKDSYEEFIRYQQEANAITFVAGFKMGDFSTTAEYTSACVYIKYYLDLLFNFKDGKGNYLFPKLVDAKDSGESERLSYQISELNVYTVVKAISPYVAEILDNGGLDDKEIYDKQVVIRQLARAHEVYDARGLSAKGVDVDLISEIILALHQVSFNYELLAGGPEGNFIRVRDKLLSVNIFGGILPLTLENVVGSYDTVKCKTKSFDDDIKYMNKQSKYGKYTYDHIHNIDDEGEELETYSETIVNNLLEIKSFSTGTQFTDLLVARSNEIHDLSRRLQRYREKSLDEELFYKACNLAIATRTVSTKMFMDKFKISYARASRLITELSNRNVISIRDDESTVVLASNIDDCVW